MLCANLNLGKLKHNKHSDDSSCMLLFHNAAMLLSKVASGTVQITCIKPNSTCRTCHIFCRAAAYISYQHVVFRLVRRIWLYVWQLFMLLMVVLSCVCRMMLMKLCLCGWRWWNCRQVERCRRSWSVQLILTNIFRWSAPRIWEVETVTEVAKHCQSKLKIVQHWLQFTSHFAAGLTGEWWMKQMHHQQLCVSSVLRRGQVAILVLDVTLVTVPSTAIKRQLTWHARNCSTEIASWKDCAPCSQSRRLSAQSWWTCCRGWNLTAMKLTTWHNVSLMSTLTAAAPSWYGSDWLHLKEQSLRSLWIVARLAIW